MPILRTVSRTVVMVAGLAVGSGGCSGPLTVKYEMVPVQGRVTIDGQPLANAEVILESMDGPRGFGVTDQDGRFTVVTRQFGPGLPAGSYRVLVGGSARTRIGSGDPVAIAMKYRETGVGRVTIGPGTGPLAFDLKKKPDSRDSEASDASER